MPTTLLGSGRKSEMIHVADRIITARNHNCSLRAFADQGYSSPAAGMDYASPEWLIALLSVLGARALRAFLPVLHLRILDRLPCAARQVLT